MVLHINSFNINFFENNQNIYLNNIQDIYLNAEQRQLKLVKIFFDICVKISIKNYLEQNKNIDELYNRNILYKNCDYLNILNNNLLFEDLYKQLIKNNILITSNNFSTRKQMINFINKNLDFFIIQIVDGNVKNKKRAIEKSNEKFNGHIGYINDINRITITTTKLCFIEQTLEEMRKVFEDKNVKIRTKWEVKSLGNLTRSSYVLIDGFINEIHFAEKSQFYFANKVPHRIYELYRYNVNNKISFLIFKFKCLNFFYKYKKYNLNKILFLKYSNLIDFKKDLFLLHKKEYLNSFKNSDIEWKALYYNLIDGK